MTIPDSRSLARQCREAAFRITGTRPGKSADLSAEDRKKLSAGVCIAIVIAIILGCIIPAFAIKSIMKPIRDDPEKPVCTMPAPEANTHQTPAAEVPPEEAAYAAEVPPEETAYAAAEQLLADGETAKAAIAFGKLGDYADARDRSFALWRQINPPHTFGTSNISTVAVKEDGTVLLDGYVDYRQTECKNWTDIVSVCTTGSLQAGHTVGLKTDGTVVAVGANQWEQCNTSEWRDVVAIGASALGTVGLRSDGTVLYTGVASQSKYPHEIEIIQTLSSWKDIVALSGNNWQDRYVGIKSDGTVVSNIFNVQNWSDMISASISSGHIVGLKVDGTVMAMGNNAHGQCNVSDWNNIIAVAAGGSYTLGLKGDGTVVCTGSLNAQEYAPPDVSGWTDIAAICAGQHPIGIKSDGSVVTATDSDFANWTDVMLPD